MDVSIVLTGCLEKFSGSFLNHAQVDGGRGVADPGLIRFPGHPPTAGLKNQLGRTRIYVRFNRAVQVGG